MKFNKYQVSIFSSLGLILFGAMIWIVTPLCVRFADTYSMGVDWLNSYFMPRSMAVLLIVTAGANILLSVAQIYLSRKKQIAAPVQEKLEGKDEWRVIGFVLLFTVYFLLLKYTNFMVSSVAASFASLALLKDKKPLHYGIAAVFVMVVFLVFKYVLYVKLP